MRADKKSFPERVYEKLFEFGQLSLTLTTLAAALRRKPDEVKAAIAELKAHGPPVFERADGRFSAFPPPPFKWKARDWNEVDVTKRPPPYQQAEPSAWIGVPYIAHKLGCSSAKARVVARWLDQIARHRWPGLRLETVVENDDLESQIIDVSWAARDYLGSDWDENSYEEGPSIKTVIQRAIFRQAVKQAGKTGGPLKSKSRSRRG